MRGRHIHRRQGKQHSCGAVDIAYLLNFTGNLYRARESGDPDAVAKALEHLTICVVARTAAADRASGQRAEQARESCAEGRA